MNTELRIGNEISNGKIVAIREDGFVFNDGYQYFDSLDFHNSIFPKLLTEEILLNYGFEKV